LIYARNSGLTTKKAPKYDRVKGGGEKNGNSENLPVTLGKECSMSTPNLRLDVFDFYAREQWNGFIVKKGLPV